MEDQTEKTKEYKEYKDKLIKDALSESKQITYDEYQKLDKPERYKISHVMDDEHYQILKYNIPEEDLPLITQLKIYQKLEKMHCDQKTMKGIMIFWLILTIIGLIGVLYMCTKIGSAYSKF